jgi:hypothetical protein
VDVDVIATALMKKIPYFLSSNLGALTTNQVKPQRWQNGHSNHSIFQTC